ncbi:MAG: hypothetical protein WAT19_06990 [Ferruginibacter sp.]
MNTTHFRLPIFAAAAFCSLQISSCKKSSDGNTQPTDPCAGKTITVSAVAGPAVDPCGGGGSTITVTASGSSNFTFKLDAAGTYQASGLFNNVSPGTYTVFAKDGDGCVKSTSATIAAAAAGTKFAAVRTLLNAKCTGCHNSTTLAGGRDWTVNCTVVANKAAIQNRAVTIGDMPQGGPQLSTTEKAVITDWINAGGRLTD